MDRLKEKRVVITGLGVVSSIGIGKADFWNNLINGKSGISEISSFDTSEFSNHYGGEIKNFNAEDFVAKFKINKFNRAYCLATAAAKLALSDAKLYTKDLETREMGICFGTTMGESEILKELNDKWLYYGIDALNPNLIPQYPCNSISLNLAKDFNLKGPNYVIPTACAAGNYSIGYAYDLIRLGNTEMMLAGGADGFSRIAFIGFNRMLAVAPKTCQPFDKNRRGMMVGEGAGMVILETLDSAEKRKADIYAEVLGYGLSADAHHMTAPQANGISRAIEKALKEANVKPEEIDYFNAHGTGTPANDREECFAIKKLFGDFYKELPVSSIKSMLGHTMGAASAIETVTVSLVVKHDIIPPTINYETPDPDCDIDCVPNTSRKTKVDIALNNASAFGGNNACLVLKKFNN